MRATTLPPVLVSFLLSIPLLVAALSGAGCEAKKSGEGESCTKTADCTGELRCVDEHCVTEKAKSKSKRDKKRKRAAATATACGVPAAMELFICTAIQQGRVQGVTVITKPAHQTIARCVAGQVRQLSFPSKATMDVARTHFTAAE